MISHITFGKRGKKKKIMCVNTHVFLPCANSYASPENSAFRGLVRQVEGPVQDRKTYRSNPLWHISHVYRFLRNAGSEFGDRSVASSLLE